MPTMPFANSAGIMTNPLTQGNASLRMTFGQNAGQTRRPTADELVENRITNLLAGTNPYVQNARTRGVRQSASRGLLNSSLGAAAGESAAIAGALPIASQDAQTFARAGEQGQDAANRLRELQFNADLTHQGQMNSTMVVNNGDADADRAFRAEQNALDRSLQRETNTANRDFSREMSDSDRAFQREMTLGDRAFRQGERESDQAYGLRMQELGFNFQRQEGETARAFQERIQAAAFAREAAQRNQEMYQSLLGASVGTALNTVMSDPAIWGDPAASSAFMARWGDTIGALLRRLGLGPQTAPNGG